MVDVLARQLANTSVDGSFSVPAPGGKSTLTPVCTPFLCELDTSTGVPYTQVIVGAQRAETWYPWVDIIKSPTGQYQDVVKTVPETLVLVDQGGPGIVYCDYSLVGGVPTATLASAYYRSMPISNSTHYYHLLAQYWWDTDHISRLVQQHFGDIVVPVGMIYRGPFAVSYYPGSPTKVVVGWERGSGSELGVQLYDQIIVHPDRIANGYQDNVTCSGAGYIVIRIVREGTVSADAPVWCATIPGNTATELYVPLAQVGWAAGAVSGIRQMQFGSIIVDRTTVNYCPP